MEFDTEPRYYVYAWYIKDTDEVFYIGKGTGKRYLTRKRENSYFMKMLNSHDCEPRIIKNHLTEKEAFELEKEMIAYYRTQNCRLTNVLDGGENPPKQTGIPKTEEWKEHYRESHKKFVSEHPEYRKKCSDNLKAYLKSDDGKKFMEKSLEARRSDEFRKAQSERSRKANNTAEYIEKQSKIVKEMWKSEDYILSHSGSNNHRSQCIKQYDIDGHFIKEYETITQAALENGVSCSKITAVAKGKRKTTGGYVWKYSSDKHQTCHRVKKYNVDDDKCAIPIIQYDLNGNFISEYKSIRIATELNGFKHRTNIIACLKGRTKSAYGYLWKYKYDNTVPSQDE